MNIEQMRRAVRVHDIRSFLVVEVRKEDTE